MATRLYFNSGAATEPMPNTKYTTDTISAQRGYACYKISTASGGGGGAPTAIVQPGYPTYFHFGEWISAPLVTTEISGTITINLCMLGIDSGWNPSTILNPYPRFYAYLWHSSDAKGDDLLPLITSTLECSTKDSTGKTYITSTMATVPASSGDRIVIEIESWNNNTVTSSGLNVALYHTTESWVEFSKDMWTVTLTTNTYSTTRPVVYNILPTWSPVTVTQPTEFKVSQTTPVAVPTDYKVDRPYTVTLSAQYKIEGEPTGTVYSTRYWFDQGGISMKDSRFMWNLRNKTLGHEETDDTNKKYEPQYYHR